MSVYDSEKRKENYEWYKKRGICTRCRRERAFGRFTMCPECLEKNSQHAAEWRMEDPERSKASIRKVYWKRKAEGRCVDCGQTNPNASINCRCPTCARDQRIRQKTHRIMKVKPDGICRICDQPVYPGKKLCYEHWVVAKDQLLAVRPGNGKHPWRQDEAARIMSLRSVEKSKGGQKVLNEV